jgi:hypothetical protein
MSGGSMTRARAGSDVASMEAATVQPLELAQVVWRRALALARSNRSRDRVLPSLDLLRAARHGPSTMIHALTLGRAQLAAAPRDIPTREAVRLLTYTIAWLGKPVEQDEIGSVAHEP